MNAQSDRPESSQEAAPVDLTPAVTKARRGFRRDTEELIRLLDRGALFVPLAETPRDVPLGEALDRDELTLRPQLVGTGDEGSLVVLFTREDLLVEFAEELEWTTTDDGDLQYCALPLRSAFDLAIQLIDMEACAALVINPSQNDELTLHRHELDALRQGHPVPLVGYVSDLPLGDDEETLVSELDEPPSAELRAALERCVERLPGAFGYRLQQTFNRERDLEPHATLTLLTKATPSVDPKALEALLAAELEGKLPAPGYVDVVFEETPGDEER